MNATPDRAMARLSAPRFVERERGVFLAPRRLGAADARDERPVQHRENEHNHQHFDFAAGATALERWRANSANATAVETIWRAELARAFPGRAFALFVANELHAITDEDGAPLGYELHPTLRLWSAGPGDEAPREAFRVDELGPDVALSFLDGPLPRAIPLAEALAIIASQRGPAGDGSEEALAAIRA